jgi:CRISPR-associated exonuclease Cas4
MLYFAALLFSFAVLFLWLSGRKRSEIGLPAGRVIYTDTSGWGPAAQPLYDPVLGLVGKPDYLIEDGDQIIPVEVKSSRIDSHPYDAHIFQLAAYCLLVQRQMGKRPPYGILHYPNRTYAIDYTEQLERSTLALIEEIRGKERRKQISRSHQSPARCHRCGYRAVCEERLL